MTAGQLTTIMAAVHSTVAGLGEFEGIQFHEPKSVPDQNSAALWLDRIVPLATASGLDTVSAMMIVTCRIYNRFNAEPQDSIDPEVAEAASAVVGAFTGEFTVDGTVRNVDIFGANGFPLSAIAGYITQDGTLFRVMTVQIPLIINDLWSEAA